MAKSKAWTDVEFWNRHRELGTPVVVRFDAGEECLTATRSIAWVMSGHTAVILLEGIAGAFRLDRVRLVGSGDLRLRRIGGEPAKQPA